MRAERFVPGCGRPRSGKHNSDGGSNKRVLQRPIGSKPRNNVGADYAEQGSVSSSQCGLKIIHWPSPNRRQDSHSLERKIGYKGKHHIDDEAGKQGENAPADLSRTNRSFRNSIAHSFFLFLRSSDASKVSSRSYPRATACSI